MKTITLTFAAALLFSVSMSSFAETSTKTHKADDKKEKIQKTMIEKFLDSSGR